MASRKAPDRDTLLASLPDKEEIRAAAELLDVAELSELLGRPDVKMLLDVAITGRGRHKMNSWVALAGLKLWKDREETPRRAPEPERKRPGRRRERPYTQGFPSDPKWMLKTRDLWDVQPQEVSWLWPGRFALGEVTVVLGRMGDGKSTFVSWLAATVCRGAPWPDSLEPNEPGHVLILQTEEQHSTAVRPRMTAMGLDGRNKVTVVDGVAIGEEEEIPLAIARHCDLLRELCETRAEEGNDVRLIIIDPIKDYLAGINGYNDMEVRAQLQPLFTLARDLCIAVVLIIHPKKDHECDILDLASGTGLFVQKARMSWYLSHDPNDHSRRLLSLMKTGLDGSKKTALALHYDSRRRIMSWSPETIAMSAEDVHNMLQKQAREARITGLSGPGSEALDRAMAFIMDSVAQQAVAQVDCKKAALATGISIGTFSRALKALVKEDGRLHRFRDEHNRQYWLELYVEPAATPELPGLEPPPDDQAKP